MAEVFSPPRFAPVAQSRGFVGRSVDIKLGTDLSCPKNRRRLKEELRQSPPDLLALCPPCTNESGWIHLNATKMDRLEFLRRKAQSRMFIRFCCDLSRAVLHPTPSQMWQYPASSILGPKVFRHKASCVSTGCACPIVSSSFGNPPNCCFLMKT